MSSMSSWACRVESRINAGELVVALTFAQPTTVIEPAENVKVLVQNMPDWSNAAVSFAKIVLLSTVPAALVCLIVIVVFEEIDEVCACGSK